MSYLIGIDIGTSGTKTVLFDEIGNTVASSTVEYDMAQPEIGWAEQDPEDWWKATCQSLREVIGKSGINADEIKGHRVVRANARRGAFGQRRQCAEECHNMV